MRYNQLGNTELKVSDVAFGGVEIGMPYGLNASKGGMLEKNEAIGLLHHALDNGINFYDTARLYGQSEQIMGEAFHGIRDRVIIASKCRHFRDPSGNLPRRSELKGIILGSIEESLNALRTDFIDVFMLHYADLEILEIDELYEIFADLEKQGKIRYPGISVYQPQETELALQKGFWKVIQLPFNLMDQKQGVHFEKAKHQGVGIVIRSVLMRGLLTDRSTHLHPELKAVEDHINLYGQFFNADIDTLASLAMKFAASFDEISSILVGFDKQEFVNHALHIFNGKYLSGQQVELAKTLGYPDQDFLNLAEWDKNGWL